MLTCMFQAVAILAQHRDGVPGPEHEGAPRGRVRGDDLIAALYL